MNKTTEHNPMQLETDNDDIAEMFLAASLPQLYEMLRLLNSKSYRIESLESTPLIFN